MIQRIQSLFLGMVMLLMIAFCFTDIWVKTNNETKDNFELTPSSLIYSNGTVDDLGQLSNISITKTDTYHIMILAVIIAILAGFSLFSYKKRVRQMKMGIVNILLIGILFLLIYYYIMEADKTLVKPLYGEYKIGFFLPIVALVANVIAYYYIKKDEDLVRSADRIR